MQMERQWIWQHADWPVFSYDARKLLPEVAALTRLIGVLEASCRALSADALLDAQESALADDAQETAAIEGEVLRRSSVRASIRKQLGLSIDHDDSDSRSDGLVAMLLDARRTWQPFTKEKLYGWQAALFPTGYSGLRKILVGEYRGLEEMRIVSGPLGRERIHYIAPPRQVLDREMNIFLAWLNRTNDSEPVLEAGIAHLWFIMIHPFDDGNGRIGRAISDALLAKGYPQLMQVISFSRQVSLEQKVYYRLLEEAGKNGMDITDWLLWFVKTLSAALQQSQWIIKQVINKANFWQKNRDIILNIRQQKVLNRLLEPGDEFVGGITTRKYAGMCKCSKLTASRDLADLATKGLIRQRPGGGRSTSYDVVSQQ